MLTHKAQSFERVLFRATRGNMFLKQSPIEGTYFPPTTHRLRDCPYSYQKGRSFTLTVSLTVYSYQSLIHVTRLTLSVFLSQEKWRTRKRATGTALRVSQSRPPCFIYNAGDCCPYVAIYTADTFLFKFPRVEKTVVVVFFAGERARGKILKITTAFGANRYPFPDDVGRQRQVRPEGLSQIRHTLFAQATLRSTPVLETEGTDLFRFPNRR